MESSDTIQPFPELPFEIICLIIEEMLEMVPKRAVELVSLSRNIRPIAERALYRCIIIKNMSMIPLLFLDKTSNSRFLSDPSFYQTRVKTLCIIQGWELSDFQKVFPACSGVQSLAIYAWHVEQHNVAKRDDILNALASTGPSPTKLSCNFRWTQRSDGSHRFDLPLFQNVTHLELEVGKREDFDGKQLYCLKQLSHLSLIDLDAMIPTPQSPGLPSQLNLADSISVCIIYSWFYCREFESDALQNLVQSTEPRIVIATYGFDGQEPIRNVNVLWRDLEDEGHFARQWGRREDAQELDMWEEAEEIVKARRVTSMPQKDVEQVKPGSGAAQGEVIEGAVPSSSSATAGSSALAAPAGTTPSRKSTLSRLGSWMGGSNEKKAATPPSDKKGRFVEDVGSNLKKNGGTPKDT